MRSAPALVVLAAVLAACASQDAPADDSHVAVDVDAAQPSPFMRDLVEGVDEPRRGELLRPQAWKGKRDANVVDVPRDADGMIDCGHGAVPLQLDPDAEPNLDVFDVVDVLDDAWIDGMDYSALEVLILGSMPAAPPSEGGPVDAIDLDAGHGADLPIEPREAVLAIRLEHRGPPECAAHGMPCQVQDGELVLHLDEDRDASADISNGVLSVESDACHVRILLD